jgi:NADH dehydrogenase/NADH:ubiquinone oxidoreductase subunit G
MEERDLSFYEPFGRLLKIMVEGKTLEAPENNTLLRCFQYIDNQGVVPGRFCWNNECGNCEVTLRTTAHPEPRRIRGCQTTVQEGMILSELTPELKYWLRDKLR